MPVKFILIPCVRLCSQVCRRDGTKVKKKKISRQGKIEFECLKIWSCHFFKQPDLDVNLKATKTTGTQKKVIASLLMVKATNVRLYLKQWVVISFSVLLKKLDPTN